MIILCVVFCFVLVAFVVKYGRSCVNAYRDERRIIFERRNMEFFDESNE